MNGTHSYLTKIKAITVALSQIAQIKNGLIRTLSEPGGSLPDPNESASRSNLTFPLPPLCTPATQASGKRRKFDLFPARAVRQLLSTH